MVNVEFDIGLAGSASRLTFIYNFETNSWSDDGPEYPDATSSYGISVPIQGTFLTLFGEQSDGTMYMFDPELDDWNEMVGAAQHSEQEHYFGTGVLIPDEFYCHCTGSTGEDTIDPDGTCTLLAEAGN